MQLADPKLIDEIARAFSRAGFFITQERQNECRLGVWTGRDPQTGNDNYEQSDVILETHVSGTNNGFCARLSPVTSVWHRMLGMTALPLILVRPLLPPLRLLPRLPGLLHLLFRLPRLLRRLFPLLLLRLLLLRLRRLGLLLVPLRRLGLLLHRLLLLGRLPLRLCCPLLCPRRQLHRPSAWYRLGVQLLRSRRT